MAEVDVTDTIAVLHPAADTTEHPSLPLFRAINDKCRRDRRRLPDAQRAELIRREFPSVGNLDWKAAFDARPELFSRVWRDIMKSMQVVPGKAGHRPNVDFDDDTLLHFRQVGGADYSTLPFHQALAALSNGLSRTTLARKTGLTRTKLQRLIHNVEDPTVDEMRAVAAGFKRDPSYFSEYRAVYITAALVTRLESNPEASIDFYRRVVNGDD